MQLSVCGLNHATAPVEVREGVAFGPETLGRALDAIVGVHGVREAAILSTCNRTEVYVAFDMHAGDRALREWFHGRHGIARARVEPCLYHHREAGAVRHLLRVVCGLDSMVVGEAQIAGQVKDAFRAAQGRGTLGPELGKVFQQAFAVAKDVRTETAVGRSPVSVASAAVALANQIFGDLESCTAVLVGAGETVELVARHLRGAGTRDLVVVNRDAQRARELAQRVGAEAVGLSRLPEVLHRADVLVSATASTLPILGKGAVEQALRRRRHRPMFLVDLAVPRDVEPEIGTLDDVFLYTIDDLAPLIRANRAARRDAAGEAERIIDRHVEGIEAWRRTLGAVDTIKALRGHGERIRSEALQRSRRMLSQGRSADDALDFLAHALTARLLHDPTAALRRAAGEDRTGVIDAASELFGLDETDRTAGEPPVPMVPATQSAPAGPGSRVPGRDGRLRGSGRR